MPGRIASRALRERGTASVELVAAVPFLLLATLAAMQLGLAGYALWSAGIAARAGARSGLVGGDPVAAARRALPPALRDGADLSAGRSVSVRVSVPRLFPGVPPVTVRASSTLGARGG